MNRDELKDMLLFLREHYLSTGTLPRINEVPADLRPVICEINSFDGLVMEWETFRYLKSQGIPVRYDVDEDVDWGVDMYVYDQPVQVSTYDKGRRESGMHYLVLPGFVDSLTDEHKAVIKSLVISLRTQTNPGLIRIAVAEHVELEPVESHRPKRKRGPRKNGKVITYNINDIAK